MKKKILAACLGALSIAAIAGPATASADYHITKDRAESFARTEFHDHYTAEGRMGYSCRPQGLDRGAHGYIYHRWTCTWYDAGDNTYGQFLIAGSSRGYRWYNAKIVKGVTAAPSWLADR